MTSKSKGAQELEKILKELFPGYIIKTEVPIKIGKKTLYIDFLIESLRLAYEYDGRQHSEYVAFFHGSETKRQLDVSKDNDSKKSQALSEMGYTLIRIGYRDKLDAQTIKDRTIRALRQS